MINIQDNPKSTFTFLDQHDDRPTRPDNAGLVKVARSVSIGSLTYFKVKIHNIARTRIFFSLPTLLLLSLVVTPQARGAYTLVEKQYVSPASTAKGIAFFQDKLWVVDRQSHTLLAIDPWSGKILKTVPSPCDEPGGLAAGNEKLWCTDILQNRIYSISPKSGLASQPLDSPCPFPTSVAFFNHHLWIYCPFAKKIAKADPYDGTAVSWLPAPNKHISALGAGKQFIFAYDNKQDELYMIEPKLGYVLNTLPIPLTYVTGIAVKDSRVWLVDYQRDVIATFDLAKIPSRIVEEEKSEFVQYRHILKNAGPGIVSNVIVHVAIPQSRPGQILQQVSPVCSGCKPKKAIDSFGQEFWKFEQGELKSGQEFWAGFDVTVKLQKVRWFIYPSNLDGLKNVPQEIRSKFLSDASKYRLADPLVRKTVEQIRGKEANPFILFQKIYHYVLENMEYKLSGGWNAAPLLLKRKTGSCSEYTILLIALLRAAGIPARYVGSIVLRGEDASIDYVFHRWAEIYLPTIGWFPVDANKGDDPIPALQAAGVGLLAPRFLVTTVGGGDSQIIGWKYNSTATWQQLGQANVQEKTVAVWEPKK